MPFTYIYHIKQSTLEYIDNTSHTLHNTYQKSMTDSKETDESPLVKTESEEQYRIRILEASAKDLSTKIDNIHSREMKKALLQPGVFLFLTICAIVAYINMPVLLIPVALVSFMMSCFMPMLNVTLVLSIALFAESFARSAIHNVQWIVTPMWQQAST